MRYATLEQKYAELRREVNSVKDCVRAMRAANPVGIPPMVEALEHDDVERWAQQQPRARVTRWGGMISTVSTRIQSLRCILNALPDSKRIALTLLLSIHFCSPMPPCRSRCARR